MKKPASVTDLSLKNKFFNSILESIAEGIVVIGLDRRLIFINRMARELAGLGDKDLDGLTCSTVIKTDLCAGRCPLNSFELHNSCDSHFMNVQLYRDDLSMDTSSIPLCLNVAPLMDENGEVIGIIENFRPMSEAVKVMESLKQSNIILTQEKDKVDSIVESLADGVFTVDSDLLIASFNRGMEQLTGIAEVDAVGRSCSDVLCGDNCSGSCPFSNTLKMGYGQANVSERIARHDGQTLPVFISTAFMKDGSGSIQMIATVRDASEIENLKREVNVRYSFSNIIGRSRAMQELFELIETLSDTDCAILIGGESGTGKELVSRAIHHESNRRNKPFVKVNCSAIVEGLFESELFGHVKGAFSGAIRDKVGKFEFADGGTIFLDEIADMPLSLQAKLLRILQDMEFEMVGDNRVRRVDVRIIAATNKDLKEEILANRFREDLYYRLCVVPVTLPPLRERQEDILLLANFFLEKCRLKMPNRPSITDMTPSAVAALLDYSWPGNVRELENAVEHAFIRTKSDRIGYSALPMSITGRPSVAASGAAGKSTPATMGELERLHIIEVMARFSGNKGRVAQELGLGRTTLWRKLKKYDLA